MTDVLLPPKVPDPPKGNENNEILQTNTEENAKPENADSNNNSGRRHYKKDNRQIANLKNTKSQKKRKLARLTGERDTKKADLDRGYLIVQLGEDPVRVKHVPLDASDKEVIKAVIAEKEYEIYEGGLDIDEIDMKIRGLASAKKSSFKNKLSKSKANKNEDDLVKRIDGELDKASKNGSKEIVSEINKQIQAGNNNDAYYSLKAFLSKEDKPVSKKLAKDGELEKNVLDRVLDKFVKAQS